MPLALTGFQEPKEIAENLAAVLDLLLQNSDRGRCCPFNDREVFPRKDFSCNFEDFLNNVHVEKLIRF